MPASDEQIARLAAMAANLAEEVNELTDGTRKNVASLGTETKKTRKVMWLLVATFAVDVLLTVALTLGFVQMNGITDRLDNAQSEQRQRGLCPLYALFYDITDTPEEREAGKKRSANPEKYDAQIKVIHDGYKNLKCDEFKGSAPGLGR